MKEVPDRHIPMPAEVDGQKVVFWYLIASPEPAVGYNEAYMESCYVTDVMGNKIDVSDDEMERLESLAFENKDEP